MPRLHLGSINKLSFYTKKDTATATAPYLDRVMPTMTPVFFRRSRLLFLIFVLCCRFTNVTISSQLFDTKSYGGGECVFVSAKPLKDAGTVSTWTLNKNRLWQGVLMPCNRWLFTELHCWFWHFLNLARFAAAGYQDSIHCFSVFCVSCNIHVSFGLRQSFI